MVSVRWKRERESKNWSEAEIRQRRSKKKQPLVKKKHKGAKALRHKEKFVKISVNSWLKKTLCPLCPLWLKNLYFTVPSGVVVLKFI